MTDTTDVPHCPTCGQRAHQGPATGVAGAMAGTAWLLAWSSSLVLWLLGMIAGSTAGAVAIMSTVLLLVVALWAGGSR